jgi:hypothetical protein
MHAYQPVDSMQLNMTSDQSSPIIVCNTVVTAQVKVSKFYRGIFPLIGSYYPFSLKYSFPAKNYMPSNEKIYTKRTIIAE